MIVDRKHIHNCHFSKLALLGAALVLPDIVLLPALAQDNCHNKDPNLAGFMISSDELVDCLNGGGISGVTVDGHELAYAMRKTISPVRLRDVTISESFSSTNAAFDAPRPDTQQQCGAIYNSVKRQKCSKMSALAHDIELENVQSALDLDFSGTVFLGNVKMTNVTAQAIWFGGSVFTQPLKISHPRTIVGMNLDGVFAGKGIELTDVTGEILSIDEGEYQGPFVGRMLNVGQFYVKKALFWEDTRFDLTASTGAFIYEAKFKSDLDLRGARIGTPAKPVDLTIADTEVIGNLDLRDTSINGKVKLDGNLAEKALLNGLTSKSVCTLNVDCP